jgi:peptidyl-prolyl cis-trans isomerase SDCCAG10
MFYLASSNSRKAEIEKIEADLRRLSRRRDGNSSDDEPSKKKIKKSYLEEELAKYSKGKGLSKKGKRKDEGDVLAALNSFRGKLKGSMFEGLRSEDDDDKTGGDTDEGKPELPMGEEDPGMEVDDDQGFLSHALHFPKDDGEESRKAERDFEVIDPRERGAKAKEEERERKRAMKAKGGGGRHRL